MSDDESTPAPVQAASPLADPLNQFTVSLFHQLATSDQQSSENVFLSPLSVSTALSMLLLGAKNESAKQLLHGLRLTDLQAAAGKEGDVHSLFKDLIQSRIQKSDSLALANYVLIHKEPEVNQILQQFKSSLADKYSAQLDDADFGKDAKQILTTVNDWVKEQTKGLIKSILDKELSGDTRALILNAIYFKGAWDKPFDASNTEKRSFFNHGTNEVQTDLMFKHEKSFPYAELVIGGQKSQVVELAYKEDGTSMLIVLPEQKDGLKHMLASNSFATDLANVLKEDALQNQTIDLYIPKFQLETEYELNKNLIDMGIADIFAPGADLSGITGRSDLYVSLIKHKAVVKVDEEGTEAAAVTAMQIMLCCAMVIRDKKIFRADHPFLFLIRDMKSGLVFFVGKVEKL